MFLYVAKELRMCLHQPPLLGPQEQRWCRRHLTALWISVHLCPLSRQDRPDLSCREQLMSKAQIAPLYSSYKTWMPANMCPTPLQQHINFYFPVIWVASAIGVLKTDLDGGIKGGGLDGALWTGCLCCEGLHAGIFAPQNLSWTWLWAGVCASKTTTELGLVWASACMGYPAKI